FVFYAAASTVIVDEHLHRAVRPPSRPPRDHVGDCHLAKLLEEVPALCGRALTRRNAGIDEHDAHRSWPGLGDRGKEDTGAAVAHKHIRVLPNCAARSANEHVGIAASYRVPQV